MLIVIACSEPKRPGPQAAPSKYLGRQHQAVCNAVLDTHAGLHQAGHMVAWFSAELGLVPAYGNIPDYERKLTKGRAAELLADPAQAVEAAEMVAEWADDGRVAVFGGKLYRDTIRTLFAGVAEVEDIVGEGRGCGDHFSALLDLLENPV